MVSCYLSTCPQSHHRLRDAVRARWTHLVSERTPIWAVLADARPVIVASTAGHLSVISGGGPREVEHTIRFDEVDEVSAAQYVLHVADDQGRRHEFTFLDTGDAAMAARMIAEWRAGALGALVGAREGQVKEGAVARGYAEWQVDADRAAGAVPTTNGKVEMETDRAAAATGEDAGELTAESVEGFAGEAGAVGAGGGRSLGETAGMPSATSAPESPGEAAAWPVGEPARPPTGTPDSGWVTKPAAEAAAAAARAVDTSPGVPESLGDPPAGISGSGSAGERAPDAGAPVENAGGETVRAVRPEAPVSAAGKPLSSPPPGHRSAGPLDGIDFADLAEFAGRDLAATAELPIEREVVWLLARSGGAPLRTPAPEPDLEPAEIVMPAQVFTSDHETVLLASTEQVPGRMIVAVHGDVLGLASPSASGRNVHDLARQRLAQAALRLGANAVVGMGYWASVSVPGEVAAYGTAVTLSPAELDEPEQS